MPASRLFLCGVCCCVALAAPTPEERATAMLGRMTQQEKLDMLHGPDLPMPVACASTDKGYPACAYIGNVPGNKRLGIPPLSLNDGPQGFRDKHSPGTTTAWPSALTVGATFDRDAMR